MSHVKWADVGGWCARGLGIAALAVIAVVGTAQAQALRPAASIPAAVVADGRHWAAWGQDGHLVVLSDAAQVRFARHTAVEVTPACPVSAIGSGLVGLGCLTPTGPQPRLYDLSTRQPLAVAGLPELGSLSVALTANGGAVMLSGIGSRLLAYHVQPASPATPFDGYFDWRAGRAIGSYGIVQLAPTEVVDLDSPSGRKRLCRPLRVPSTRAAGIPPTPLVRVPAIYRDGHLVERSDGWLRLHRCGSSRAVRLTRAPAGGLPLPFGLSGRFVAWSDSRSLYVRTLGSKPRSRRWSPPRGQRIIDVEVTGARVFATVNTRVPVTYVFNVQKDKRPSSSQPPAGHRLRAPHARAIASFLPSGPSNRAAHSAASARTSPGRKFGLTGAGMLS